MEQRDLEYDIFYNGQWIGMATGYGQYAAFKMVKRSLPEIADRCKLIRWYGRKDPRNCKTSGGLVDDPT